MSNYGFTDGSGSNVRFENPWGITVDSKGNLFLVDSNNNTIRKITPNRINLKGSTNGTGSAARFITPIGIEIDNAGNLFVADYNNHTIRRITSAGVVTALAGSRTL